MKYIGPIDDQTSFRDGVYKEVEHQEYPEFVKDLNVTVEREFDNFYNLFIDAVLDRSSLKIIIT